MNMVLRGSIFAVRLTKADPKCPGVCSYSFCSINFTIDITKSCMHAKKRGGKAPKHAQMFPCHYSPLSLRAQISNYLQMNDKQHLEISQSALNFWKPKVKPVAELACGLARPGINPRSLLLTSTATELFIYWWFSCFSRTCFHKPGESNNAAIPATRSPNHHHSPGPTQWLVLAQRTSPGFRISRSSRIYFSIEAKFRGA